MLKIGQEVTATPSVPKPMGTNLLPGTATLNAGTTQAPVPTQIKVRVLFLNTLLYKYQITSVLQMHVVCAGKKISN